MTTSCTRYDHPYKDAVYDVKFSERGDWIMQDKRLKGQSLGEALDVISGGALNYVGWVFNVKKMVEIIDKWMELNDHPIFNLKSLDKPRELPYINYNHCPADKTHKEVYQTQHGLIRCAHKRVILKKDGFFSTYERQDGQSGLTKTEFVDEKPYDPTPYDWGDFDYSKEYEKFQKKHQKYENARVIKIMDICGAVISDKGTRLSLESVISRVKVNSDPTFLCVPFSGFDLADYVESWYNQGEPRILFNPPGYNLSYRHFPDFVPYSSED